jgi:hypothetical protein
MGKNEFKREKRNNMKVKKKEKLLLPASTFLQISSIAINNFKFFVPFFNTYLLHFDVIL